VAVEIAAARVRERPMEDDMPAAGNGLRSLGAAAGHGFSDLGTTKLARELALTDEQTNGHWCSRCEGYTLEAECPVCGSRKG
jgi:hypothetical protein